MVQSQRKRLFVLSNEKVIMMKYRGTDKSLARPTSPYILFDGENISFEASLVIYIYIDIVLIFLQL